MLLKIKKMGLMTICFLMLSTTTSANAGLLLNGDFENGFDSWDTFGNAFIESTPDTLVEDSSALKMFGNFSNQSFTVVSQFIAVDGTDFSVGDKIMLEGLMGHLSEDALQGINRAYIEIAFAYNDVDFSAIDFGNAVASQSIDSSSATDVFFEVKTPNVTIPDLVFGEATQFIRVAAAFVQDDPADRGAIWVDNLNLQVVPAPSGIALILLAFIAVGISRTKK